VKDTEDDLAMSSWSLRVLQGVLSKKLMLTTRRGMLRWVVGERRVAQNMVSFSTGSLKCPLQLSIVLLTCNPSCAGGKRRRITVQVQPGQKPKTLSEN
jgi:hypothetical protein